MTTGLNDNSTKANLTKLDQTRPNSTKLRKNISAQNSIFRSDVYPTLRLHLEKYFSVGYKHLAQGNSSCVKKKGCYLSVFKEERKLFSLKFNLEVGQQQDYLTKIISFWGINILLRVIEDAVKEG
jgi:hypothetical protein